MAVRTKRLARGNIGAGGVANVVYVAPAGETVIVKDIRLWVFGAAVSRAQVWVTSGPTVLRLIDRAMASQEAIGIQPWVVLQAGETISVQSSVSDTLLYWVSGTELEGVAD